MGDRVLVQLDKAEDHTVTTKGIIVPLSELSQKDSGGYTTVTSPRKYLAQGTVLHVSKLASEHLAKSIDNPNQIIGKKVLLTEHAVSNSFAFYEDKSSLVRDFEGLVAIPHNLIEAVLNEKNN